MGWPYENIDTRTLAGLDHRFSQRRHVFVVRASMMCECRGKRMVRRVLLPRHVRPLSLIAGGIESPQIPAGERPPHALPEQPEEEQADESRPPRGDDKRGRQQL